jgi:hypothetical protein
MSRIIFITTLIVSCSVSISCYGVDTTTGQIVSPHASAGSEPVQAVRLAGGAEQGQNLSSPYHTRPYDYQIVIADEPTVEVASAATELSEFLERVTDTPFPIVRGSSSQIDHQIIVGPGKALDKLGLSIDWDRLGPEGFVIRTVGQKLVIAGGKRRGTANGVYTFLEDIVGCRWYTPRFSVIPHKPNLSVGPLNIEKIPVFESRAAYCGSGTDANWAARQRLNTFTRDVMGAPQPDGRKLYWYSFINDPKLAGSYYYVFNHVHTLGHNELLSYDEFDRHPEYFALVDGKRFRKGQPCMTNPGLLQYIIRRAKDWIKIDPMAAIISVSQGDFANACQCPNCQVAYKDGGKAGLYMRFVNKVAEEITKEYPEILIDTLAYQWTRKPPENIRMHKNVVIRYAPIVACYRHAFDECDHNIKQNIDSYLIEWIGASSRTWVWYYALSHDDLQPYPNLNCLSRNFKRMRDIGVKGFFIEGKKNVITGGLADLQAYLFAKLMWDPDYNVEKGIEEFCNACYGSAARQIISYVKQVNDQNTYANLPGNKDITNYPDFHMKWGRSVPVKKNKLSEMDKLFDHAELAVANEPDTLERVKLVRLSLQYAIMKFSDKNDPIYQKAIDGFIPLAKKIRLAYVRSPKTGREEDLDTLQKNYPLTISAKGSK